MYAARRAGGRLRAMKRITGLLALIVVAGLGFLPSPFDAAQGAPSESRGAARAQMPSVDCAGYVPEPASAAEWKAADLNNQQCAAAGLRLIQNNRAVAAAVEANAGTGDGKFSADPFRAPRRWAGRRGSYQELTFKHRDGK